MVPLKGMNTVASQRMMAKDFSPELINLWYDDGITLKKRLAQTFIAPPATGTTYKRLDEIRKAGVQQIIAQDDRGYLLGINPLSAAAPVTFETFYVSNAVGGVITYTNNFGSATLGGKSIVGDGLGNAYIYDGVATSGVTKVWKSLKATQTPSLVLGNIFHVHHGRCYAAGDPAFPMTVRYSDTSISAGLDYWSPTTATAAVTDVTGVTVAAIGSKGGFIDISSDLSEGDVITGLATHRGYFVVFCKKHILFYNITDPNLAGGGGTRLYKIVSGEGCVSQNSIQGVGEDTIFLSPNGFKKLSVSMIQGDSQVNDLSQPVNNVVKAALRDPAFIADNVSSTYNPKYGIYICNVGADTWCYQTQFEGWFKWSGIQPALLTDSNLDSYVAGPFFGKLDNLATSDSYALGTATPFQSSWVTYPFKAEALEHKPRWNRVEILYEDAANSSDLITVWAYPDLDLSQAVSQSLTASVSATLPDGRVEKRLSIPLSFRSELLTVKISSASGDIRFSLVEAYYNDGGIR